MLGLLRGGLGLRGLGLASRANSTSGNKAYDCPGKTTVDVLNEQVGYLMVDAYSGDGFRLNNGMKAFGPIAVFPTCVLPWFVGGASDVTEASLALFGVVHPRPDLVILGKGLSTDVVDVRVLMAMRKRGISVECMSTEDAIASYNYLCAEERLVAAALIPPAVVRRLNQDDVISNNLLKSGYKQDFLEEKFLK